MRLHDMTREERLEMTRLTIALLDNWGIAPEQQIALLALPPHTKSREIRRYRDQTPFPEDPSIYERIEHLVGIAEALRTSYPHSAYMGNIWLNRPNDRFDNRSPLACMIEDGIPGFIAVRAHLDCSYDWETSAPAPPQSPGDG